MEANKQGSGEEDLSMEEILQSIRKIIADDGEEGKPSAAAASEPAPSDVLELTDMITDDGALVNAKDATESTDVLGKIDAALSPVAPAPTPVPAAPVAAAEPVAPAPSADTLLSEATEKAALAALNKLKVPEPASPSYSTSPSPAFRSGATVEDMVEELLRPMLRDWLNANLPAIIERVVEREVQRLTRR